MKKNYENIYTACKETGDFIERFETVEDAKDAIKRYEAQDKAEGTYTEDFYDIVDENHCTIDKRGGSRPNSGRKPNGEQPRVAISCRVDIATADWLREQGNIGETIDNLVKTSIVPKNQCGLKADYRRTIQHKTR